MLQRGNNTLHKKMDALLLWLFKWLNQEISAWRALANCYWLVYHRIDWRSHTGHLVRFGCVEIPLTTDVSLDICLLHGDTDNRPFHIVSVHAGVIYGRYYKIWQLLLRYYCMHTFVRVCVCLCTHLTCTAINSIANNHIDEFCKRWHGSMVTSFPYSSVSRYVNLW